MKGSCPNSPVHVMGGGAMCPPELSEDIGLNPSSPLAAERRWKEDRRNWFENCLSFDLGGLGGSFLDPL